MIMHGSRKKEVCSKWKIQSFQRNFHCTGVRLTSPLSLRSFLSSTGNIDQQMKQSSALSNLCQMSIQAASAMTIKTLYIHRRESSLTLYYHHWTGKHWYTSCSNWGFTNSNVNSTIRYCFLQQNHYYISDTILSFTKIFILTLCSWYCYLILQMHREAEKHAKSAQLWGGRDNAHRSYTRARLFITLTLSSFFEHSFEYKTVAKWQATVEKVMN